MGSAMNCPNCGLENPPSATRCDCGFDFNSRRMAGSFVRPSRRKPNLNLLDSMFLVQGSVIDIAAVFCIFGCVGLMAWLQVRFEVFDFPLSFLVGPFLGVTIGLVMKATGWKNTSIIRSMLWASVMSVIVIVLTLIGAGI